MADDTEELLVINNFDKQKTSTPRSYDKTETEITQHRTKSRKQSKETNEDEKTDNKITNPKKQTKQVPKEEQIIKNNKENIKRKTSTENDANVEVNNEEEEEEETEMTAEEKEDMYNAVRNGDFLNLNNALDKKNADINMTWYKENLLMAAIRSGQTEMAEFLIDAGIDYNFKTKFFNLKEKDKKGKRIDCYEKSCRDLAFDLENDHIVEVIDVKNKNVFPFVPVTPRTIWRRRPQPPELPKHLQPITDEEEDNDEDELSDCENSSESKLHLEEIDSGHPSARSNEKTNDDSLLSDVLDKMNGFGRDEGYGTMSPSGSPYLVHAGTHVQPEKPRLFYRPTKASMAIQSHNNQFYRRRVPSKSAPLLNHINTVGSYAHEKKRWEHQNDKKMEHDTVSIQSLPFYRSYPSSASSGSRRSSVMSSPLIEVTKILGQSRLLTTKPVKDLKSFSTQRSKTLIIPSVKVNQWCHDNSKNVFHRLSNTNNNRNNRDTNFSVTREINRHYWK